jgi:hypothetical protein
MEERTAHREEYSRDIYSDDEVISFHFTAEDAQN